MKYIFFLENYSIIVLNDIYKLQLQRRYPEEVLFLALPSSLPKYTSQLFPILPPGGNLVAFLLRSLQPNSARFRSAKAESGRQTVHPKSKKTKRRSWS